MTLRRLAQMVLGYTAACCTAASVITIAVLLVRKSTSPFVLDLALVHTTTMLTGLIAGFVAVLALIPFLIAVVLAERTATNSPGWYLGAGAAAGVVGLGLNIALTTNGGIAMSDLNDHPVFATLAGVSVVAALAGACAGFMYWLIAGRPKQMPAT